MPAIEFLNAGKQFGPKWVFRGATLRIPNGQFTAILGQSGAGKTSLLQLVNGLLELDEGELRIHGKPIPKRGRAHFRRGIGYAVQGAGLFPHLTAGKNSGLVAKLSGWNAVRIKERVEELFVFMGLDPALADRYPYELSGGQQQRIGLCRAIMLRPELVLLDEPFVGIDNVNRNDIIERFGELQRKEKFTVLMVTHGVSEALALSRYMIVLGNQRILQHGPTQEVLDSPEELNVKPLLECPT